MHQKPWHDLSSDEQDLYLRLLWQDGYTEQAIADFFQTTKGRIVRRRANLELRNEGRLRPKQVVNPERFRDLLDLHAMDQMEKRGAIPMGPVESAEPLVGQSGANSELRRVAVDEQVATPIVPGEPRCEWPTGEFKGPKDLVTCREPVVPGHKLCAKHRAFALRRPDR